MPDKEYSISELIKTGGLFNDGDWIESKDQDPNGEVRLIQLGDIGDGVFIDKSDRYLSFEKANELKCTFLRKGDILIARMPDPIGRSCVFPGFEYPCVTVVDVAIIRPNNPSVYNDWLKYKLNSPYFRHLLKEYTNGTTRTRISRKNLNKIKFRLPIFDDQVRTAVMLEKSEDLIKKRIKSIDSFDELIQAQFWKMFGDTALNDRNFITKPLSVITSKIGSGTTPRGGKEVYLQEGRNCFLRSQNIRMFEIDFDSALYLTEQTHKKMKNSWVKYGDVLLTITGASIGRVAWYQLEDDVANVNQHVCIIRPIISEVNPVYLSYCIGQSNYQQKILSRNVGGTRQAFNFSQINNFEIPLPSIDEQNRFQSFVSVVQELKLKSKEYLNELKELTNALAERAFNGELNLEKIELKKSSIVSYSAFEDRPELSLAAIKSLSKHITSNVPTIEPSSDSQHINNKIQLLKYEKHLTGKIPLDIDYLKYLIKLKFRLAFRAETLHKFLLKEQIEHSYDVLVNLVFEMLKGKKPFLKQIYYTESVLTIGHSEDLELIEVKGVGLHIILSDHQ
ncbi:MULTISPECIES: restriction endonuclease subunit S [unclassified Pedobacter]|uniref:restriction endonuclease subunit S n=1 Tax=unclassified Pedobacter TaxID=2628915 RepID=UPI001D754239|nr:MULTISPECIES: restriction endonuclease subunit S [unclassified Pedobacter]CAH0142277.1 hypothetical protein SRABI126_00321 [Pedobacter sp. Bi126]CAH0216139.1 hypothetical protein SRABI36_02360 [Pedobacter sp. Bi36]